MGGQREEEEERGIIKGEKSLQVWASRTFAGIVLIFAQNMCLFQQYTKKMHCASFWSQKHKKSPNQTSAPVSFSPCQRRRGGENWTSEPVAGTWYPPTPNPPTSIFRPLLQKNWYSFPPPPMTQSAGIFLLSLCEIPQGGEGGGGKGFFPPVPISFGTGDGYCTESSPPLLGKKEEGKCDSFYELCFFYFFWKNHVSIFFFGEISFPPSLNSSIPKQLWNHQHQRVPNTTLFFVMFLSSYPNDTKKSVTPLDSFFPFWHQKVQSDSHPTDSRIK